ncbi:MAG TPA: carboxypeptidase regulatory-like domain-containing protein [Candidatus Dormibacteraeota bacterium]|nr:carboxypeptidase regulatory-like domain-containing protein [Candidatus Dormibacteraeota bacterium]
MNSLVFAFRTLTLLFFLLIPLPSPAQQTIQSGPSPETQFASIAGQVLQSGSDQPLKKARILLTAADDNSAQPYIAASDADGRFVITDVRAGRYKIEADRDGFLSEFHVGNKSGDTSSILSLNAGQKITDLVFRLQQCGVITGRVLDEDGDPVRSVTVVARTRTTHRGKVNALYGGSATTNDLGEYRIFDLRPGSYFVTALVVSESGMVMIGGNFVNNSILLSQGGYASTYYPSASNVSRASTVDLQAGTEASGIDITMLRQRSYKIRGKVINEAVDRPLSRFEISVSAVPGETDSEDFSAYHAGVDRKTGEFEITGVPAGSYQVTALLYNEGSHFYGSAQAEVVNSDLTGMRIVIGPGAQIHGRVIKEGNLAASSIVQVAISPRDPKTGFVAGGKVNSDGSFALLGVADGLYDIGISSRDCGTCFVKSATAGGVDILDAGLTVSSGSAPSPVQLIFSTKSGTLDGTVRLDDGSPVSGATVVLAPDHPHGLERDYCPSASTDQSGYFSIPRVEPGNYHIFAWRGVDSEDLLDPTFRQPFIPKAQAFSIAEAEKKTLHLTLLPLPSTRNSQWRRFTLRQV